MEYLHNFATATLSEATSAGAVTIGLTSAAALPVQTPYRALLDNEIIIVTAVAGNTLTVQRGAENTAASPHSAGATLYVIATAGALTAVREQSVDHVHPIVHRVQGGNLYDLRINMEFVSQSIQLYAPNKSGILATLEDVSSGIPPASDLTLGGVIVGSGLNVLANGMLSAKVASVNGKDTGAITLTAADVSAIPTTSRDQPDGVPTLSDDAGGDDADTYYSRRLDLRALPVGAAQAVGVWQILTNQAGTYVDPDSVSYSLSLIDGGQIQATGPSGSFDVLATGMMYIVSDPSTTFELDGIGVWAAGDVIMSIDGRWVKIKSNASDGDIASAVELANTALSTAGTANSTANAALALASSQPVDYVDDEDVIDPNGNALAVSWNRGYVFVELELEPNIDITVPLEDPGQPFTEGYNVRFIQNGPGTATLVAEDTSITLLGRYATTGDGDVLHLVRRDENVWFGY